MGDSEITVARNLAEGAGGFFKGIVALPLSGQYTHYSLDKKTYKPNYVTDPAASATAWATGTKAPDLMQALNTKDGAVMTISYGNSEEGSQEPAGSQLRIAAYGPHAGNVVRLTDQTDLFFTSGNAMGLKLPGQ